MALCEIFSGCSFTLSDISQDEERPLMDRILKLGFSIRNLSPLVIERGSASGRDILKLIEVVQETIGSKVEDTVAQQYIGSKFEDTAVQQTVGSKLEDAKEKAPAVQQSPRLNEAGGCKIMRACKWQEKVENMDTSESELTVTTQDPCGKNLNQRALPRIYQDPGQCKEVSLDQSKNSLYSGDASTFSSKYNRTYPDLEIDNQTDPGVHGSMYQPIDLDVLKRQENQGVQLSQSQHTDLSDSRCQHQDTDPSDSRSQQQFSYKSAESLKEQPMEAEYFDALVDVNAFDKHENGMEYASAGSEGRDDTHTYKTRDNSNVSGDSLERDAFKVEGIPNSTPERDEYRYTTEDGLSKGPQRDASMEERLSKGSQRDVYIEEKLSKGSQRDACIEERLSKGSQKDAYIEERLTKGSQRDACMEERLSKGSQRDAYIEERLINGSQRDAYIDEKLSKGSQRDACIEERLSKGSQRDAYLEERPSKGSQRDAYIEESLSKGLQRDVYTEGERLSKGPEKDLYTDTHQKSKGSERKAYTAKYRPSKQSERDVYMEERLSKCPEKDFYTDHMPQNSKESERKAYTAEYKPSNRSETNAYTKDRASIQPEQDTYTQDRLSKGPETDRYSAGDRVSKQLSGKGNTEDVKTEKFENVKNPTEDFLEREEIPMEDETIRSLHRNPGVAKPGLKETQRRQKNETPPAGWKEIEVKIHCNPDKIAPLLRNIALMHRKRGFIDVNVDFEKISEGIIKIMGEENGVRSLETNVIHYLQENEVPLSHGKNFSSSDDNYHQDIQTPRVNSFMTSQTDSKQSENFSSEVDKRPLYSYHGSDVVPVSLAKEASSFTVKDKSYLPSALHGEYTTKRSNIRVRVMKADITNLRVDAVVNAANSRLKHGGGVAKAIADKAGPRLLQECEDFTRDGRRVDVTNIFVSSAGDLLADCVIHAVGPKWDVYKNDETKCARDLRQTVLRCLVEAAQRGCKSIALPSISAAIFKVPVRICTRAYLEAVQTFDAYNTLKLKKELNEINFVDILDKTVEEIQDFFMSNWSKEPSLSQMDKDFFFASGHCNSMVQRGRSDQVQRGRTEQLHKQTKRVVDLKETDPRPTVHDERHYKFESVALLVSTKPAFCLNADLVLVIGDLFQNLHFSPVLDVEKDLQQNKDYPFLKNSFRILGGDKTFPLTIQFPLVAIDETFRRLRMNLANILENLPHIKTIVVTSSLLYASTRAHTGQVDRKLVGDFTRNLYELLKTLMHDINGFGSAHYVILATSNPALQMICNVLNSRVDSTTEHPYPATASGGKSATTNCPVCFEDCVTSLLQCCNNMLCAQCKRHLKPNRCPFCKKAFGILTGDQPSGSMCVTESSLKLKGHEHWGSFIITYKFFDGKQGSQDPNPGAPINSATRIAYLPASPEGKKVLLLLKLAFLRRLTFTIGDSLTTGKKGVIVWNGIHHKTSLKEESSYGYPDKDYLKNVTKELEDSGVVEENMTSCERRKLNNYIFVHPK